MIKYVKSNWQFAKICMFFSSLVTRRVFGVLPCMQMCMSVLTQDEAEASFNNPLQHNVLGMQPGI